MSKPLVTVCIPTYNGAAHLSECLESVCLQTYREVEILVVDDCSTDQTAHIISEYQKRDRRLRFVRNARNLGLTGNWERCAQLAKGDYIKFAFQDDVLYPQCIDVLMRSMQRGVRFAFCAREFVADDGTDKALLNGLERGRRRITELFAGRRLLSPELFCQSVLDSMQMNIVGEPTVTLMHRDVLTRYGHFNPDFVQIIDFEYWCRVGANESISYVPEVLAKFRLHAGSETSRNLTRRVYQAEVVDRLLLLHEFAFAPIFGGLREVAQTRRPPLDLVDLFYDQAYWAAGIARERCDGPRGPQSAAFGVLEAAAARYPALLGRVPLKYALARKWRAVRKLVRGLEPSRTVEHQ